MEKPLTNQFPSILSHPLLSPQTNCYYLITIIISLTILIITVQYSLHQKKRHGLPVWPFIGMLPYMIMALCTNIYDYVTAILREQNGTFTFRAPFLNSVITANPWNLEHVLKTNFSNFPKGPDFRTNLYDLLGDGIFNADHEMWRRQRKPASVVFHSAEFRRWTAESLLELVHSRLVPVLEEKGTKAFDLQDVLLRLTFDNVCIVVFGVDPGCLSLDLPEIPFARAFEDATEVCVLRMYTPIFVWKMMRFLNLGWEKRLKKLVQKVDEFADEVISTRMKELVSSSLISDLGTHDNCKTPSSSTSDLLTVFMGLKDDEERPFSSKFLRDICVSFILAGRDTSSVALSWFFWLIDQNPNVEEKILEELRQIIVERDDFFKEKKMRKDGTDDDCVVFEADEVKKMEYLQAALSESMRLYPPVPFDLKEVDKDDVLPDGTVLRKGFRLLYSIYSVGRMESIWGKDCYEFKPQRWLRDGHFVPESPYKFPVFNGGPRLCIGKDFAYHQMMFVVASVIYRYRVKVVKNHPVVPKITLTMYMKYGLQVTLEKRDKFGV